MSVRIIVFTLGALFMAAGTLPAAEYLRNPGFVKQNATGGPAEWELRDTPLKKDLPPRAADRPAARSANGILSLDTGDGRFEVMLIHNNTPLKSGSSSNLSFQVRGIGSAGYRAVAAWTTTDQATGKPGWKTTNGNWVAAPAAWNTVNVNITLPADGRAAYLYLAANGPGKVEFKEVRLRDAGVDLTAADELAIFAPGKPVEYQADNLFAPANQIQYTVTDFSAQSVAAGKITGYGKITLSGLANGYYEINAREIDRTGKLVAERKRTFAIIPEVPEEVRTTPNNQFGAMVNPHTHYPMEQRLMDAKFMNRIGIRYVRTHRLNWVQSQAGPNQPYNWTEADAQTAIYQQYGIKQIATTGWPTPQWASDAKDTNLPNKGNFVPKPEMMELHRQFYTELAKRYKGAVAYYEIGNEVDASNFWLGKAEHLQKGDDKAILEDYIAYYTATAKAIKAGDSEAIVGPGTTGAMPEGHTYKPWMERFWSSPALEYTDIFCAHYSANLDAIREVMRKHHKEVPVVMTEIGGLVLTEKYELTPENFRQLIKRTYSQFVPRLNGGAKGFCKFLLRKIPEVREGWISEMLDSDYTIRPEYVAYATLIRLTAAGKYEKELNLTKNTDSGWLEAYQVQNGGERINIIMLNDTPRAKVTLPSPARQLKIVDVMGCEKYLEVKDGKIIIDMVEDTPIFVIGELTENPGAVKHPEPQLISSKIISLSNANFELTPENGKIPGWGIILDEQNVTTTENKTPFKVTIDQTIKSTGKQSVKMASEIQTKWNGILGKLPMSEIPVLKAGQYIIFRVSYDQKADQVVGTGAGLTLAFRNDKMQRVSFAGGNWEKGSFDWKHQVWTSGPYPAFHRDCRQITLEFYLGVATGKVWIDNVKVEVELWQKSNAAASYIN